MEGECRQERDGRGLGTQVPGAFGWIAKTRIGIAPESLERFKAKVRELWDGRRSRTSNQLRDEWNRYARGWWGYFRLAEARRPIYGLEQWVRRHIRKCFWLRWHDPRGRLRSLRRLGLTGTALGVATSRRGAWRVAAQPELHKALSNSVLRQARLSVPSVCRDLTRLGSIRRMRKNRMSGGVGGCRAQSPALHRYEIPTQLLGRAPVCRPAPTRRTPGPLTHRNRAAWICPGGMGAEARSARASAEPNSANRA